MTHKIPTGTPALDAAIRSIAEEQTRRQWAANVARFREAGMNTVSLDDPEATPEAVAVVFQGCDDVLRDLDVRGSYDAGKRLLSRLLGWPETVEGPAWRRRPGRGWVLEAGKRQRFFPFAETSDGGPSVLDDYRSALIAALLAVAGREG